MIHGNQQMAIQEEIVRAVIQGRLPISALDAAGITLEIQERRSGGYRRIRVQSKAPLNVELRPVDVAQGLLAYRDQPEALRDWATYLLSDIDNVDLERLVSCPEGDEMLKALWDASFEGRINGDGIRVASALVNG
jgi:hypothetical protein